MLIDSKIHALEILEYTLFVSKESEKVEIIKRAMLEFKRFAFRMDEDIFFQEIRKREEGEKFLEAHGIRSLEELVINQYEYRMKYEWGLYRNVSSDVDLSRDDCDELIYLD